MLLATNTIILMRTRHQHREEKKRGGKRRKEEEERRKEEEERRRKGEEEKRKKMLKEVGMVGDSGSSPSRKPAPVLSAAHLNQGVLASFLLWRGRMERQAVQTQSLCAFHGPTVPSILG